MIPTNFDHQARALRAAWIRAAGIPADLRGVRLRGTASRWGAGVYEGCMDWVNHFCTGDRPLGKGLLLTGPPGRGKTTLAAALLQECLIRAPHARLGHDPAHGRSMYRPGLFVPYARLLADRQELIRADRAGVWTEHEAELSSFVLSAQGLSRDLDRNARLVVLDDLGKEHTTASRWAEDSFDLMLRTREAEGWPTIVTTNTPLDRWAEVYGESMGSFAHQAFWELPVTQTRDLRVAR